MNNLNKAIAELYEEDNKEVVTVYGNFSLEKAKFDIPQHISNQLTKTSLIAYVTRNGAWRTLPTIGEHEVCEVRLGNGRIIVATTDTDLRYIIGV